MTVALRLSWVVCVVLLCSVSAMSRAQGTSDSTHVATTPPQPMAVRRVELRSRDGALHGQFARLLSAEIDTAIALGRIPLVELGATWCGACQTLDTAMRTDSMMIQALAGSDVIHVDIDDWPNAELQPLGLESETGGIPAVIAVDRTGKSVQQAVDIADLDQKNEVGGMARAIKRLIQAQRSATTAIPGIPNRPDVVTVIPFYWKPNETDLEQTKVIIPAEIDGRHGIVNLDLGAGTAILNRTFLQPSLSNGVDTITDANRVPDSTSWENYLVGSPKDWEKVHVTMRIGTLLDTFDCPGLMHALEASTGKSPQRRYNAILNHMWGNFSWVFAPRLGNIGPAVYAPFETIIDYTHRRVVLIRLDSSGHRLVQVPGYTPIWTSPLVVDVDSVGADLKLAVRPDNTLDTLKTTNNTEIKYLDTGTPKSQDDVLGYDFLSQLGVFGLNQRTHQFILYR